MEKIFRAMACPEEGKPELAIFMLSGEAEHWWTTVEKTVLNDQKPISWKKFTKLFYEKYFSASMRKTKEMEFLQLAQKNLSVSEYEQKFNQLSRFAIRLV